MFGPSTPLPPQDQVPTVPSVLTLDQFRPSESIPRAQDPRTQESVLRGQEAILRAQESVTRAQGGLRLQQPSQRPVFNFAEQANSNGAIFPNR